MATYNFEGSNIRVDDAIKEIKDHIIRNITDDFVTSYSITIKTADDTKLDATDILDRMVQRKWAGMSMRSGEKYDFIREYLGLCNKHHVCVDGYINPDSIWYYRNFNRFVVSIGAGFLMNQRIDPGCMNFHWSLYSLTKYIAKDGDDNEQLITKLNTYLASLYSEDERHTIHAMKFCSEVIYILHRLFSHMDASNQQKYEPIDVWWDPVIIDRDVFAIERMETQTYAKIPLINGWLKEFGVDYKFYIQGFDDDDDARKTILLETHQPTPRYTDI